MPSSAPPPPLLSPLFLHDALPIYTPPFSLRELSRYDERGPAWYWNAFETGEHTGTHFDAPVHWVSGKDLPDSTVDRIAPKKFIGPRSEEHTSELQSLRQLVCRLLHRRPPYSLLFSYTTLFRSTRRPSPSANCPVTMNAVPPGIGTPSRPVSTPEHISMPPCIGSVARTCRTQRWIVSRRRNSSARDRKSTRLNSSHLGSSYAVFCTAAPPTLSSFPTRRSSDLHAALLPPRIVPLR